MRYILFDEFEIVLTLVCQGIPEAFKEMRVCIRDYLVGLVRIFIETIIDSLHQRLMVSDPIQSSIILSLADAQLFHLFLDYSSNMEQILIFSVFRVFHHFFKSKLVPRVHSCPPGCWILVGEPDFMLSFGEIECHGGFHIVEVDDIALLVLKGHEEGKLKERLYWACGGKV